MIFSSIKGSVLAVVILDDFQNRADAQPITPHYCLQGALFEEVDSMSPLPNLWIGNGNGICEKLKVWCVRYMLYYLTESSLGQMVAVAALKNKRRCVFG